MTRQDELNEAWCKYMGKCSTEILQALAFALRWCDEHPNWISVEDELPKDMEIVLALGKFDAYFLAYYDEESWFDENDTLIREDWGIAYWMPLPEPPRKGVRNERN